MNIQDLLNQVNTFPPSTQKLPLLVDGREVKCIVWDKQKKCLNLSSYYISGPDLKDKDGNYELF